MVGKYLIIIVISLWALDLASAHAETDEAAPPEEVLQKLQNLIDLDPNNLDHVFNYAKLATAMGEFDRAIVAYQHMLQIDPLLHRIKLDLGLLYIRTGQFKDAKALFFEVLDTKPPDDVVKNINIMLEKAEEALEKHSFSGTLAIGYNYDTNANSSPRTGEINFVDISLPLSGDALRQADSQYFATAVLNYRYRHPQTSDNLTFDWNNRVTFYNSTQANLDTQDVNVMGFKTGPSLELKKYKTRFSLEGGYQQVELDNLDYLYMSSVDFNTIYRYNEKVALYSTFTIENRHFINTEENNTYADRSGNAYQMKLGVNYAITNKDIIASSVTIRRENTRKDYLDNNQLDLNVSYTHQFSNGLFANIFTGNRWSYFDEEDIFVSATTRHESETYTTLTIGKEIHESTIGSIGYQYRLVTSNIQNYAYDNHRVTASVGWSF